MDRAEIKKMLEESKQGVGRLHEEYAASIRDDLQKFKKKAMEKI